MKIGLPTACLALCALVGGGCWPDTGGTPPPVTSAHFYYPVGLGMTQPTGRYLLVVNSNFDLAYNSGTVVPFDLEPIRGVIDDCRTGSNMCPSFIVARDSDAEDADYLVVDGFLLDDHSVRIGSYGSYIAVTEELALVPVRADSSLHFIDVYEPTTEEQATMRVLRCEWGEGSMSPDGVQTCGSDHRVTSGRRLRDDMIIGVPADPYGITAWHNPEEDMLYAVVGHMVTGDVSLFEVLEEPAGLPRNCGDGRDNDDNGLADSSDPGCMGQSVRLVDVNESFAEGTTGIVADGDGRFLATSRFESRLTAFRTDGGQVSTVDSVSVSAIEPGDNQRGIVLSPSHDRAYVASRAPASVLVLDLTRDEDGDYVDQFSAVVEIGEGASVIQVYEDERFPAGYLVYVVCFQEDRIFVIDPSVNQVIDVISTRKGPHDIVFDSAARVAYLANFLESTVSVLDVDPESPLFHSMLTTMGKPRRPRTND